MNPAQPSPNFVSSIDVSAGMGTNPPVQQAVSNAQIAAQLQELTRLTGQMVAIQNEQLQLARRNEERITKQIKMQRDEFDRWLSENPYLRRNCNRAEEAIRNLLGNAIAELVEFAEDQSDDLMESDYMRQELVDKFGTMLNHVSSMYGILKRLSEVERQNTENADSQGHSGHSFE